MRMRMADGFEHFQLAGFNDGDGLRAGDGREPQRAIDLGGVEERDALFDRRPDQGNHLLLVTRRAVTEAHAHAAQPDGRDFQIAFPKFTFLHIQILSQWKLNYHNP